MNDTIQLKLQLDMFTANTKVQLMSIAKDIYLGEDPGNRKAFLDIYRTLSQQVFGKIEDEVENKPQV